MIARELEGRDVHEHPVDVLRLAEDLDAAHRRLVEELVLVRRRVGRAAHAERRLLGGREEAVRDEARGEAVAEGAPPVGVGVPDARREEQPLAADVDEQLLLPLGLQQVLVVPSATSLQFSLKTRLKPTQKILKPTQKILILMISMKYNEQK